MADRKCGAAGCSAKIPAGSRIDRKYCSDGCRDREAKRRYRKRSAVKAITGTEGVVTGSTFRADATGEAAIYLRQNPSVTEAIMEGRITQAQVAQAIGVSPTAMGQGLGHILSENRAKASAESWTESDEAARLLGRDLDDPGADLDDWLDAMVERFAEWRDRFFETSRGPFITRDFAKAWIRGVLTSIETGGRQLILSPPRHGKSELMVHFAVWLIIRNPNIRIIWIGGNSDISGDMVSAVKVTLEENEALRKAYLPPGNDWVPPWRKAKAWGSTKFTVNTRSINSKAPTMVAIGRAGKILSRDVDLIICDDIEDFDSTLQEGVRSQTRHWWFNTVESRKEEHTAWVTIGSRQHPDDLYSYLLEDDEWASIVDSAHDPECAIEESGLSSHIDCMLFPELRSYAWLEGKRRSAEAQGLLANFEMVYLNNPRPPGMAVFDRDAIEACYNPARGLGLPSFDEPRSLRLVAGLDPSATGYQAGFLWAYDTSDDVQYMVDIDNRSGGGIDPALALMERWRAEYGCYHWVIEENGFQRAIRQDPRVTTWASTHGVYLEGHQTQGGNKNDPLFGVGGMSFLYEARRVDLPYRGEDARMKTTLYSRQMLSFVDQADKLRRQNRKSDVLMASWFPQKVIRRWQKERQAAMSVDYEPSYQGWDTTDLPDVPWS